MKQTWTSRFACAFRGLAHVLRHEPSGRVHAAAFAAVIVTGVLLRVSAGEWALLSLACGGVMAAEALNTAIERLADRVSAEREEPIRLVKDAAAGGVLAASIAAVCVALAVFGPKLADLVTGK